MFSSCCTSTRETNFRNWASFEERRQSFGSQMSGPEEKKMPPSNKNAPNLSWLLSSTMMTRCDEGNESTANNHSPRRRRPVPDDTNPYKDEIQRMQRELDEENCKVCMYTGVAVCTGLSLYFVKLATDDSTLHKNRRFLWVCSAGSLVAGVYRWYLG